MKRYIIILFTSYELFASPFGGANSQISDIELSDSEKIIFQNQKNIRENKKDLMKIKLQLSSIKESVEGLKSIVESTNDKISQTTKQSGSSVSKDEINKLKNKISSIEKENDIRFKKIESSIEKLLKLLSVSKTNKLKPPKEGADTKEEVKHKKIKKITPKEALKKAEILFKKKKYKKAVDNYLVAADKKYKLNYTYYKMAECFYYQKKYDEAIAFYKKSVNIKDDPKFLPRLLLHTGISFKKIGDKQDAKKFLNTVKSVFPKSTEAKLAAKFLKNL